MMKFREKELRYFYDEFLRHSGIDSRQADDYDKLCYYLDAFLFSSIAASELTNSATNLLFKEIKTFYYIKALRNISAHYGAPHIIRNGQKSPFFTRLITESSEKYDNQMELRINIVSSIKEIKDINTLFRSKNNNRDNQTYIYAIDYLESIKGESKLIHEVFSSFLDDLADIFSKAPHST